MNPETESRPESGAPAPMNRTAVLAAMFAVPCCCPPMSLLACITGVVALWQFRREPAMRGRWIAWTAIALGAVSAALMSWLLWTSGLGLIMRGPQPPLEALMRADTTAMREQWTGPAADLDAAALRAFSNQVHDRYGDLRSAMASPSRPLPLKSPSGKPILSVPSTLVFERATIEADLGLQLFDERSGDGVMRWRALRLIDPQGGDLIFPPGEPPPPPASAKPPPNPAAAPSREAAPSPSAPPALR